MLNSVRERKLAQWNRMSERELREELRRYKGMQRQSRDHYGWMGPKFEHMWKGPNWSIETIKSIIGNKTK